MKKILGPVAIIIVLLVVLGLMIIPSYNKFVTLEENINQSYAQVENQLQRRLDLIPNLVNSVKGFASHEKEVIGDIADARARLAGTRAGRASSCERRIIWCAWQITRGRRTISGFKGK